MANLDGIREKFVVIKTDDINKYLDKYMQSVLDLLLATIYERRLLDEKRIDNKYLVINTDEPYADEVIEILKRNGHWG